MDGASQSQAVVVSTTTHAREVDPLSVTKRLQRDGRWAEVEPVRDRLMKECKNKGMSKADAQAWTYAELDRLYPPLATEWTTGSDDYELGSTERSIVSGLNDLPASWGQLPANASLHAEIAWCQANRLWVVEEKPDGATVVHLKLARSPAPSWSALGWLETSIRAYSKSVDVAAKVTATHQDQQDLVRRERMAIDEIRSLLAEMREDSDKGCANRSH
ncbi:MAG: hypothetical protein ACK6A7_21410 [Planctomycetota bacterium]